MPPRLSPASLLVTIILLVLLFNPGSTPASLFDDRFVNSVIASERLNLDVTSRATFEDIDSSDVSGPRLNLTGFRGDDGFYWNRLPTVKARVRAQLDFATPAGVVEKDGVAPLMFRNVSGWTNGHWVRSKLPIELGNESAINRTLFDQRIAQSGRPLTHNITGTTGKFQVALKERNPDGSQSPDREFGDVSARISLQDTSSSADGWDYVLKGVHDHASGSVILTTTSESFAGIFSLAQLALSPTDFERLKPHLIQSLNTTINRQDDRLDGFTANPWGDSPREAVDVPASPTCELIVYLQQFALSPSELGVASTDDTDEKSAFEDALHILRSVEDDLLHPQGLFLPSPPPMRFAATVFSPDCGYVLESRGPPDYYPEEGKHLTGLKYEVRIQRARQALFTFVLILLCQLFLLMRQISECGTPSKKSRVSFGTISMLSFGSGFTSFAALLLSSIIARLLVLSMSIAFLAFMDGLFFSMRFLLDIWTVQEPERLEVRRRERHTTSVRPQTTAPEQESLLPTIQPSVNLGSTLGFVDGAVPIVVPMLQPAATATVAVDTPQTTFGSLYTRYCLSLLLFSFLSTWVASSWPQALRTLYANTLAFVYLSFWIPQIWRNVMRNCRKALSRRFVIGQSMMRLVPVAYFWAFEDNVLFTETDTTMLAVFAAWIWIQVVILFAQEIIGPRFFVSEAWSWIPAAYDYHPVLREDEEGATLPVGFTPSSPLEEKAGGGILDTAQNSSTNGKKSFDCVICLRKIEVPVVPSGEMSTSDSNTLDILRGGFLARRHYSVTPCRHIFHSNCLENWMSYRLQCPVCRESLPPQ